MKETIGLHSSFEDIYTNRELFPDVYSHVSELSQTSEGIPQKEAAVAPRIEVLSPFEQARADYREKPHTPELVGAYHTLFWEKKAQKAGIELEVGPFKASQKDLDEHEKKDDMVIYVPDEVSKSRALLERLFPGYAGHYALQNGNTFKDSLVHSGYLYTEAGIDAPFLNTTEDQLRQELKKAGKKGMNLTGYFVAGQVSKDVTGKYLDQHRTWVRLLGSSGGGRVVYAYFNSDGNFDAYSLLDPQDRDDVFGGRSVLKVK